MKDEKDFFGCLYPFISQEKVTDIDFNGSELWLCDTQSNRYRVEADVTEGFLEEFSKRVANLVSKPFNRANPILEAETEDLRITIVHESVAVSGRCICIRKSLPSLRISEESIMNTGYMSERTFEFLKDCVKKRMNFVFVGDPGAGKTECAKFFSGFIPEDERVITIEETLEWHFKKLHPKNDAIELKVSNQMDYGDAIRTSLRLNPKWMMLSEARGEEVVRLLECFSTGTKGFTTLHTDDVRTIPDRMCNMARLVSTREHFLNDIYSFIDVGVLIKRRDESTRYIDQVCLFKREGDTNKTIMIVEDGRYLLNEGGTYGGIKFAV